MIFNEHSNFKGKHAFLSASNYHWLRYDDEHLETVFINMLAKERGTKLHEFAATCIELGQKLPKSQKTLNMYVNDAIGYKMTPEQILFYSVNCFGTADAISFRDNYLRIHDLKTGDTPAHMDQLYIYAALFCLEYKIDPNKLTFELRIYQNNEIITDAPEPELISSVMETIKHFDKIIENIKEKET